MASATAVPTQSFSCHCGKSFTRIENLKRHEKSHTNGNAHVCPQCGRSFSRVDVLRRHVKMHEGHRVGTTPPDEVASASTTESASSTHTAGAPAYPIPNQQHNLPQPSSSSASASMGLFDMAPIIPTQMSQFSASSTDTLPFPLISNTPSLSVNTGIGVDSGPSSWSMNLPPGDSAANGEMTRLLDSFMNATQPIFPGQAEGAPSADFSLLWPAQTSLSWDDGMMWSLQDTAPLNEIDWTIFGISPQASLDMGFTENTFPPISVPPSRPPSPPIDQTEEDKWPTNYQPRNPFMLGMSGKIDEVRIDPKDVPALSQWSRFWLDQDAYDRVLSSLAFAQKLPGGSSFKMPTSLYTVNTLISLYFDKFLPQLPILHLATFQIPSAPPLLVAAFMMIGACLSNLRGARAFAVDLVEIIRRTIANLFEMDSMNLRNADLLHVSLLTSFSGLWSGHQRSFELAELSRGMLINLSRRTKLLENSSYGEIPLMPSNEPLQVRWQKWISAESKKRFGLAMFLFDSLFPAFLDMPSYLSQGEMINTVLPCDDRFWRAPSAQAWQAQLGVAPLPPAPYFSLGVAGLLVPKYAKDAPHPVQHLNPFAALCLVNALHHHIWEFRSQLSVYLSLGVTVPFWAKDDRTQPKGIENGFEGRKVWLEDALDLWGEEYYNRLGPDYLSQGARGLYHLGYISLNAHLRELYAISGKFGPQQATEVLPALRHWATSPYSVRASTHALRLLKVFEFPQPNANFYAPVSVFVATLCLWVFVSLKPPTANVGENELETFKALYGDATPVVPSVILKMGVRYLSGCKEWRIGSALALVLAKMMDQGGN